MGKIEKDGMVAVLISRGQSSGWSSFYPEHKETLCMDAEIVQAVLDGDKNKAAEIAKQKCGGYVYTGGAGDLVIKWVKKGAEFKIDENNGRESIRVIGDGGYMVA